MWAALGCCQPNSKPSTIMFQCLHFSFFLICKTHWKTSSLSFYLLVTDLWPLAPWSSAHQPLSLPFSTVAPTGWCLNHDLNGASPVSWGPRPAKAGRITGRVLPRDRGLPDLFPIINGKWRSQKVFLHRLEFCSVLAATHYCAMHWQWRENRLWTKLCM